MTSPAFTALTPEQQDALLNGPAISPPDGVVPNFSDPPNFSAGCYAITSVCLAIATICVFVRLYTKFVLLRQVRTEDCLLIAAYGIYLGMVYCMYRLCAHIGFRVHEWDIRLGDLSGYLYVLHICNNLYPTFVLLSKPAILLDWVHIFVPARTRNSFFWACHVLIWAIVIIYSAKIILDNLICSPIQMLWDPFADGKCFSRLTCSPLEATWNGGKDRSCWDPRWVFLISSSSINATANLFILVLPQRVIWKLNIPKKNKIGISIVFASGILVIFASAFRVSSAAKLSSPDTTYFAADLLLCSLAEMTLSIFVVCAPVASRMWKHLRSLYKTLIMRRWVRTRSDPTTDQSDLPWASIPGVLSKGPDYRKIDHNAATAEKVSPSWPINNSRGIMCTNEIRSTVQDRSDSMVADQFGRIHPWVVEG